MQLPALSDTATWSVVVGVVMPWLVAVVQQPHWSSTVRTVVAIVCSLVGGVLTCLSTGAFAHGPLTIVGACLLVLVASQAVYKRLFPASQAKLEALTSRRASGGGRHEQREETLAA